MTFSYPDFLSKIAALANRRGVRPARIFQAMPAARPAAPPAAALAAAGAAADALQEQAVHLPDPLTHDPGMKLQDAAAQAGRLDLLLASLWRMTDDLALIREEFRQQSGSDVLGAAAVGVPTANTGGFEDERTDELASIVAQVNAVEDAICAIVAELTSADEQAPGNGATADFLERVERHKADVVRKTATALNRLRLQAIQLAAAVQSYRASRSLASQAIERIRKR